MEENEVKGRKVAIDIVKANIFAVVIMVVAAIVFLVPFFWIWAGKKHDSCHYHYHNSKYIRLYNIYGHLAAFYFILFHIISSFSQT